MRQRRKRLVKSIYKREGKTDVFESNYKKMSQQKNTVLKNFDSYRLEEMLKTSTKNVAQEVASILINQYRAILDLTKPQENYPEMFGRGATIRHNITTEIGDWAEDDEKEENEIPSSSKNVMAASSTSKLNKFNNLSDFNNRNQNQLPKIPPSVNYNNYFNKQKYRYTSKPRLTNNNSTSLSSTQTDFKSKIHNLATTSKSSINNALSYNMRRNSQKGNHHINDRKTLRPEYKHKQEVRDSTSSGQDISTNQISKYSHSNRIQ